MIKVFFFDELKDQLKFKVTNSLRFLVEEYRKEDGMLNVTEESLQKSLDDGEAVVAVSEEGELLGYSRISFICMNGQQAWYELGSSWVRKDARGMGVCVQMYGHLLPRHERRKYILAITTNPAARRVGEKFGFVLVRRKELPTKVWCTSCFCGPKLTGVSEGEQYSSCKIAYGEEQSKLSEKLCCFRVTPGTARLLYGPSNLE